MDEYTKRFYDGYAQYGRKQAEEELKEKLARVVIKRPPKGGGRMIAFYYHNDMIVSVVEDFKGLHKSICVCHQGCTNFHPGEDNNCQFAQQAYELSKQIGIALIMECQHYTKAE